MKKNLLFLFTLGGIFSTAYGQDTYINDAVVVKVNPNTLFYNGGSVNVNSTDASSTTEKKIINQGNIQIQGGFTNTNTTGKNFVNEYTSDTSYGQLIISDDSDETKVTGKVVMERIKPTGLDVINNNEYLIALPFQNSTVKDVINTMTGEDFFSGACGLKQICADRSKQTILAWDIADSEYDAVTPETRIEPYKRYLLQYKQNNTFTDAFNSISASKISFTGIPNNKATAETLKSGFAGNDNDVIGKNFGQWKDRKNHYGESFDSYFSNYSTASDDEYYFGKNLHRLGNPYTSNLDLSDVNIGKSWITFNTIYGEQSPIEAFNNSIRFYVYKIADGFSIKWNNTTGNISTGNSSTMLIANLRGNGSDGGYGADNTSYFWTGNAEALLVKPYETFFISYSSINPDTNPNRNEIQTTNLNLTDSNKIFNYNFDGYVTGTDGLPGVFSTASASTSTTSKSIARTKSLLSDEDLKRKGMVTDFDFTQLELFLTKSETNEIQGSPSYLLNANFMETGIDTDEEENTNPVFFYEETKDGSVLKNSKTTNNSYNNEDYIAKPLAVGFNNLETGKEYRLNLNLYEYSILNKVKNLNLGKYYLLDKLKNKFIDVDGSTEVTFTADDKINDRFEFYWNDKPAGTLGTDDLSKTNVTYLYSDSNKNQFIRFEQSNTTANVAVFDLTGRQIFNKDAVSTNSDYQLNLSNVPSVYVVKIMYKDGKTVTKKTIKK